MNMVGHASRRDYGNALVMSDTNKIFPERFEKLFRNGIFALVRCPYKVDEDSDVGMGHGAGSDCTRGKECRLPPEHEMNKENRPPPHPSNRNSGACRGTPLGRVYALQWFRCQHLEKHTNAA